jgi:hypothetical protein
MAEENAKPYMTAAEMAAAQKAEMAEQMREAERKTQLAIKIIEREQAYFKPMLRDKIESDVAEETWVEAASRRRSREKALLRQLQGESLLPEEKATLETSGMKPVGPETAFLTRCFNRISNARRLKRLFNQEIVELIAEKKAAAEAEHKMPLNVTAEKVKQVPDILLGRMLLEAMMARR